MIQERHTLEGNLNDISESSIMNYKKMVDMRICETLRTKVSTNLGTKNHNYVPCNNMHWVQRCVSEVQGEGKVTVRRSAEIYDKYGVSFLLRCFGIRYKLSLSYTVQPCELHNSRQCQ